MESGTVFAFDLNLRKLIDQQQVTVKKARDYSVHGQFKVSDIKCRPDKLHKLLIAHEKSHVQVYSLHLNKVN